MDEYLNERIKFFSDNLSKYVRTMLDVWANGKYISAKRLHIIKTGVIEIGNAYYNLAQNDPIDTEAITKALDITFEVFDEMLATVIVPITDKPTNLN